VAGLGELVGEALGLKRVARDAWTGQSLRHLDVRALVERRGAVRWEEYVGGGERRVAAGQDLQSLAVNKGRVCAGLVGGSIQVWNRSTLELERTLAGHNGDVRALLFAGGRLVSGCDDNSIRVWHVATGQCECVLEGHTSGVTSLAVIGGRLLSGSNDRTVRVWGMEGVTWRGTSERILDGQSSVHALVAWGNWVACGCADGYIRVWSSETWELKRALRRNHVVIHCLVVDASRRRLISSCGDGTVRVWSTETWGCVQRVQAYATGSHQYVRSLVVSGSALVGGSGLYFTAAAEHCEVRVWNLDSETLRPLHTLAQQTKAGVWSLVRDGREVWGAVGKELVVWGWRG
jgi:WD40 repeat protein